MKTISKISKRYFINVLAGLLLGFLLNQPSYASDELTGRVVSVADDDTITIVDLYFQKTKVRLDEIDAPEKDQPFGLIAKQMLNSLIYNKEVKVLVHSKDDYGRTLGRVFLGEIDINSFMVRQGGAWAYRHYLKDNSILEAESLARAERLGLWSLPEDEIIPPWDWRHYYKGKLHKPLTI